MKKIITGLLLSLIAFPTVSLCVGFEPQLKCIYAPAPPAQQTSNFNNSNLPQVSLPATISGQNTGAPISGHALKIDSTYLYRLINLDDASATQLLEDPDMQRIHLKYLEHGDAGLERVELEYKVLKGYLDKVESYNPFTRPTNVRRLSFLRRIKEHAEKRKSIPQEFIKAQIQPGAQKPYGYSDGSIPQQPIKIADVADMVSTTVTTVDHINPELSKALQEVSLEFQSVSEFDFDAHYKQIESNLTKMEQAGLFKNPESKSLLLHGFRHFFESLKPNDPRENPREFALNVVKYTGLIAFHSLTGGAFVPAQMAISIGLQAQRVMSLDTENMTNEQIAEALAEELAMVAWDIAVAKAAPAIQDKVVNLRSNIFKKVKPGNLEQAVLKTAEGVEFKVPQGELVQETNVLQNAAEKKIPSSSASSVLGAKEIPKVANMKNVFELNDFGKALKKNSIKTKFVDDYTDSQVYEIVDKMTEYGLARGDRLYLDKYHKDHIEVFRNNRCINVLNLDGSVNEVKAMKAIGEGRRLRVR